MVSPFPLPTEHNERARRTFSLSLDFREFTVKLFVQCKIVMKVHYNGFSAYFR
jgi:hypothetical protein